MNERTKKSASSPTTSGGDWDHSSRREFYDAFADKSLGAVTLERFRGWRNVITDIAQARLDTSSLDVVDIGCGAGTLSRLWAEEGHRVVGLDVNEPLIELARNRAAEAKLDIRFKTGSATDAPFADKSFDICLAPELLEHVADWRSCLSEFARILRPNGLLFVSTTNVLCPLQNEFTLPLYSWYPGPIKRYCERLAVTSGPQIANFATYPAVNWFTYYGLRKALIERGFGLAFDRFAISAMRKKEHGPGKIIALSMIRSIPPIRLLAYALTKGTVVIAIKS